MSLVLDNATVFTGDEVKTDACVTIEAGRITHVGTAGIKVTHDVERIDISGRRLVPGFVDIQVNGGGGVLFNADPSVETIRRIADAHMPFGTTSLLPTLISDDLEVMRAAVVAVRDAIDAGIPGVIGIHFEGPFLNPGRKGAHDESKFRSLDEEAVDILTSLGSDAVTLVTLAPERNDPHRIRALVDAGVIVFAGHTAATYDESKQGERAGVSGYTHLFNAMTPFGSRDPGVVGAALESATACFGIIADGHHVHPSSVRHAVRSKYPGGALLVTDAMPTVGGPESWFELNGERIYVRNGVLRNDAGSLAGSHLTMIEAVKNTIAFVDIDWTEAVRMASVYPSRAIGRADAVGSIAPGQSADLVELDEDLRIHRVWRRGRCGYEID